MMTFASEIRELPNLEQLLLRVHAWFERILGLLVAGRRWKARALLAVLALVLLRAFPSYDALSSSFVQQKWQDALLKADRPLADMGQLYAPDSHESKLTYRLTVPLVARLLHLRMAGVLLVSALLGILLLGLALHAGYEITGCRRSAFLISLAVGCSWPGEAAFHELRGGYYDAAALCLLLLALCVRSPALVALFTFLAAWTDERALLAAPCVLLFHLVHRPNAVRVALGVVLGLGVYTLSRLYMTSSGSYQPALAGIGFHLFARQMNVLPVALWSGLGGCWAPIAGGCAVLFVRKRYAKGLLFAGLVTGLAASAFCVIDTTRSVSYLLPAVFVGLAVLRQTESADSLARIAAATALLSFFVPPFYLEGGSGVWWLYPLPVQLVRWLVTFRPGL
ncbi:hypothetical protein [Paludibaculum fermentans]|uniref:hypothetical protein n=1 Tax=Paludibaculum fermentans TaxID=1473598 RepID=UPI003EBE6DCC